MVGISQVLVVLLSFLTFIELNYIVVTQIGTFICVLVVALQEYFFASVTYIT